jgi:hypothetical protein
VDRLVEDGPAGHERQRGALTLDPAGEEDQEGEGEAGDRQVDAHAAPGLDVEAQHVEGVGLDDVVRPLDHQLADVDVRPEHDERHQEVAEVLQALPVSSSSTRASRRASQTIARMVSAIAQIAWLIMKMTP